MTSNGNLGNTGTATNVSIQLLDSDGSTPFKFTDSNSEVTSTAQTITNKRGKLPFTARYYAEADTATAGTVVATAQYSISYK